jgi:hypothetical protein
MVLQQLCLSPYLCLYLYLYYDLNHLIFYLHEIQDQFLVLRALQ